MLMKNEVMKFVGKWIELENIVLSEINLQNNAATCMVLCVLPGSQCSDERKGNCGKGGAGALETVDEGCRHYKRETGGNVRFVN